MQDDPRWARNERPDEAWIQRVLNEARRRLGRGSGEATVLPGKSGPYVKTIQWGPHTIDSFYGIGLPDAEDADSLVADAAFRVADDDKNGEPRWTPTSVHEPMDRRPGVDDKGIADAVNEYLAIHRRPKKLPSLAPRDATRVR